MGLPVGFRLGSNAVAKDLENKVTGRARQVWGHRASTSLGKVPPSPSQVLTLDSIRTCSLISGEAEGSLGSPTSQQPDAQYPLVLARYLLISS